MWRRQDGEVDTADRVSIRTSSLDEKTMGELQEGMEAGRYTARSTVELYLDRSGPELRSILETNEHALTLVDELDRERRETSSPAAVAGYPNVTVPAGWVHGLPIGLSFFGPAWSEPVLLRLAFAFEQAIQARAKPGFAETLAGPG